MNRPRNAWLAFEPKRSVDYKLSRQVSAQIDEIIRYTDRNFGPLQTREYIDGLYYSFELLTDNPRLGRNWREGKRRYIYRSHVVYYRIMDDHLFITEILHGRQHTPDE